MLGLYDCWHNGQIRLSAASSRDSLNQTSLPRPLSDRRFRQFAPPSGLPSRRARKPRASSPTFIGRGRTRSVEQFGKRLAAVAARNPFAALHRAPREPSGAPGRGIPYGTFCAGEFFGFFRNKSAAACITSGLDGWKTTTGRDRALHHAQRSENSGRFSPGARRIVAVQSARATGAA